MLGSDFHARTFSTLLLVSAALMVGSVLVGCGGGSDLSGLFINNAEEQELGQQVDTEIRTTNQMVMEDDPLDQWAEELVQVLADASGGFRDPDDIGGYKVDVIANNGLVNAFAAPGGYVYITTGLILQADTCAEIAGVMGHELAHVTERHSVESLIQAAGVETIARFLLGDSFAFDALNGIFGFLQGTQFSQSDESEADEVGLQIAFKAGYNPYGLADFFEKLLALQQSSGGEPSFFDGFLSSHPATDKRINDITQQITNRYSATVQRNLTQSYTCIGTSLTLAEVKALIDNGNFMIDAGTGTAAGSLTLEGPQPEHDHTHDGTDDVTP